MDCSKFNGKVAMVTGAASGIGAAVSRKLVSLGMKVYGCDVDRGGLGRMEKEFRRSVVVSPSGASTEKHDAVSVSKECQEISVDDVCFVSVVCDLRKEEEISAMFRSIKEKSGYAAVCVLSAGVGHKATLLQGQSSMFRDMFDVNVLSCVLCAQGWMKLMKESGMDDGHLVLINSGAGHAVRVGKPDYADFNFYNATKFALNAITEGLRFELRLSKSKARVSQISPGLVETNFTHSMYPDEGHIIDMLYRSVVTLKPEDVADAVLHAISRPQHVQVHDIFIKANGPDRPADWDKKVAAQKTIKSTND